MIQNLNNNIMKINKAFMNFALLISMIFVFGPNLAIAETCMNHGQVLPIDNEQVLQWKSSTQNQFHSRGNVSGTVDEVFHDQTGHRHFSLKIGSGPEDHIEVIYNEQFGQMPEPSVGDNAEACGDYITATSASGGYPPSPDGALIHWVHRSPNPSAHDSGFVIINGVVYGN